MANKLLHVSPAPHVKDNITVEKLMYRVILALVPALFISVFYFGMGAVVVIFSSVLFCLLFEWLINKYIVKAPGSIKDGSAIVTGLLLGFCLPANLPLWIIIIGSLVAIGVGKMTFGGLGKNPFNPALVGRVFLFISFPAQMTSWPKPKPFFSQKYLDAITGPTPLGTLQEGISSGEKVSELMSEIPTNYQLFIGNTGGSAGEIAAVALLIGLVYMLVKRVISWHIPVSILATVFIFTGILWYIDPTQFANPVFHLLSGGLMLGAVFMATDYVTSPMTAKGMLIYGVGIGALTVIIRLFGSYPEGVQFAILFMNALVPLMDRYIKPRQYGKNKTKS